MCYFIANWKGRRAVIDYCVSVMDSSVDDKAQTLDDAHSGIPNYEKSRLQRSITSDQVKVESLSPTYPSICRFKIGVR